MNPSVKQTTGHPPLSSRIRTLMLLATGLLTWNGIAAPNNTPAPPKKPSYDSYRMVKTRNIFDPDRRAMTITQAQTRHESKPVTRSDYVALTGAMVTDDSTLAFFSGSRSEYNKVLSVKGSIAGATIVSINPDNVVVERNGQQTTVAVGQTVPFDNSAPTKAPAPNPGTDSSSSSPFSSSAPATSSSPGSGAPAPSTNTSDVMRRMMERRQQESK